MAVLALSFPAYRWREPALRRAALREQHVEYARLGAELFGRHCVACHGMDGTGNGVAPTLYAREFLGSATDPQITWLISGGVPGTVMTGWSLDQGGPFTDQQVLQVITYLRTWEATAPSVPGWRAGEHAPSAPPPLETTLQPLRDPPPPSLAPAEPVSVPDTGPGTPATMAVDTPPAKRVPASPAEVKAGELLFGKTCIACHGPAGAGTQLAPALNRREVLDSLSDARMIQSITRGRPGTVMLPNGKEAGGLLSAAEIRSLVAYIRSWTPPPSPAKPTPPQGKPANSGRPGKPRPGSPR
jgi:mono/diheme cytochrome c family protein